MGISSVSSSNSNALSGTSQQAQQLQTLLASLQKQPTLLDYLSASDSGSSSDILDLSSAGQSAADQLDSSASGGTQTLANTATSMIAQKLTEILAQSGIDTSKEIDLEVDAKGNVVVSNDNPQKQQIENAINSDPTLKEAVTQYLDFLATAAPTLSSSQSQVSSYLQQLWAAYGGNSGSDTTSSDSTGSLTLKLQGDAYQATYQDANERSTVLVSSS